MVAFVPQEPRTRGRRSSVGRVDTLWSPYDERRTRLSVGASLTLLVLMALGWLGVGQGLAFLATPVVAVLCWRVWAEMGAGAARRPGTILVGALVALALLLALLPVMDHVLPALGAALGQPGVTSANQESLEAQFRAAPVLMGVMVVLVGPVQEELVYRYGLFRTLERLGPVAAHGIAAVVFMLQHTLPALVRGDLWQLLPGVGYLASGLVLSLTYARTKNLAAPLLAHMAANAVSVALALA